MFLTDAIGKADAVAMNVYEEGCLLPVLTGETVLASGRYPLMLRQLRDLSGLEEAYFLDVYEPLIINFIEFVQALPAQPNGPLFELLNRSFLRALSALQHFMVHNSGRNAKPIYRYAVFSAALLLDVSKVVTQQKILITDKEGAYIADWLAYLGDFLPTEGEYYKFYFYTTPYSRLDVSLTVLLAKQIMPAAGFSWISSDFALFADWLDALQGNVSQGGRISTALSHLKFDDLERQLRTLGQMPLDMLDTIANEDGEKFFKWLKEGIADGSIKINEKDSLVHVVAEGVFLEKKLFKQFCDLATLSPNAVTVLAQFGNLLGIASKGGGDFLAAVYVAGNAVYAGKSQLGFSSITNRTSSMREGVVISDPSLLILNSQQLGSSSGLKLAKSFPDLLPNRMENKHENTSMTTRGG